MCSMFTLVVSSIVCSHRALRQKFLLRVDRGSLDLHATEEHFHLFSSIFCVPASAVTSQTNGRKKRKPSPTSGDLQ